LIAISGGGGSAHGNEGGEDEDPDADLLIPKPRCGDLAKHIRCGFP
jgi:hypothetical protein